ncbi:MAG: alanine--tRNA ligase-related protein [bacterium]|nr:alanine--tRNA ligase-related protein [bacterium]
MTARELKKKYLEFFKKKGHTVIPSASLVPEHDPTVLFTTAGMHPLVPFLLGEPHPAGKRLVNVQKSFRTDDIDDVGDPWHNTFFEMLGNWSLGDYWKREAIEWSLEFLTRELGLDPNRVHVTVFGGDKEIPGVKEDTESIEIWKGLGIPEKKIYKLGKKDNWWGPVGATGPCGPDTEMFYDTGGPEHGENCQPGETCGKYAEIWNDVFMEFNKTTGGKYEPLKQKNVDTGMGVERTVAILQGKDNVYDTEIFTPIMEKIKSLSKSWNDVGGRIIADHLRASVFLISDGVKASNVERGYILRRLVRRAIRYGKQLEIPGVFTKEVAQVVVDNYKDDYSDLEKNSETINNELLSEEERFETVLDEGLKKSQKVFDKKVPVEDRKYKRVMQTLGKREVFREVYNSKTEKEGSAYLKKIKAPLTYDELKKATVSGKEAFDLYQTFGFPIEMIIELAQAKNLFVDVASLQQEVKRHQEVSRAAGKKFAGGLADHSDITIREHTATHLLHQALRDVLGNSVHQIGSNITPERIRFDFSHSEKLTEKQIKQVEDIVNSMIKEDLSVKKELMTQPEADKAGAIGLFREKYADKVSIYKIGDYSIEYCGGPHVGHTGQVGKFKIIKGEALGAGQRRIRAVLNSV